MPTISVAVPVYNIEAYLPGCLDSILCQTFTDFELILVDDGSQDGSGAICDAYARRDARIRVVHQENKTLPAVRNLEISMARGEFVSFVDGDDLIHPRMLEILYSVLKDTEYPFAHCAFHRFSGETADWSGSSACDQPHEVQVFSSEDGMVKMLDWKNYGHYVWRGLHRRSYIRQFPFPMDVRWQDVCWSGEVVGNAGRYAYLPLDLYAYRTDNQNKAPYRNWQIQRLYFDSYLRYIDLTERLTPGVAARVRAEVFHAFTSREYALYENGIMTGDVQREIGKMAKACKVSARSLLRSDLSLKRKCVDLLYIPWFSFGCWVRRGLMKIIERK